MEFGIQKLKGGAEVYIEDKPGICGKCGAEIFWAKTKNNKFMPVEFSFGEWASHFASCPFAKNFKKKKSNLFK